MIALLFLLFVACVLLRGIESRANTKNRLPEGRGNLQEKEVLND